MLLTKPYQSPSNSLIWIQLENNILILHFHKVFNSATVNCLLSKNQVHLVKIEYEGTLTATVDDLSCEVNNQPQQLVFIESAVIHLNTYHRTFKLADVQFINEKSNKEHFLLAARINYELDTIIGNCHWLIFSDFEHAM